ncbi:MAG: SPOR domain-containing protein [Candidatus Sericytochromatia bacterium]|nr:SPOR domain-containing protein [Candidatus Sericytochromatia bacterium]
MARGADLLANMTYWTALVLASAAAFTAGFHYTHGATANVPVKQPVSLGESPSPLPAVTPRPTPSPTPTPAPGPIGTPAGSLQVAPPAPPPPGDQWDATQAEAGFATAPPLRSPVENAAAGTPSGGTVYRVQVGAFDTREGAQRQVEALQATGLNAVVVWDGGSFRAQLGAFTDRGRAFSVADEISVRGFPVTVRH